MRPRGNLSNFDHFHELCLCIFNYAYQQKMCNNCIKLKMFSIPHNFVEVTHFYNVKPCFSILLFCREEWTQQLTKSAWIRCCANMHLISFLWSINQESEFFVILVLSHDDLCDWFLAVAAPRMYCLFLSKFKLLPPCSHFVLLSLGILPLKWKKLWVLSECTLAVGVTCGIRYVTKSNLWSPWNLIC